MVSLANYSRSVCMFIESDSNEKYKNIAAKRKKIVFTKCVVARYFTIIKSFILQINSAIDGWKTLCTQIPKPITYQLISFALLHCQLNGECIVFLFLQSISSQSKLKFKLYETKCKTNKPTIFDAMLSFFFLIHI